MTEERPPEAMTPPEPEANDAPPAYTPPPIPPPVEAPPPEPVVAWAPPPTAPTAGQSARSTLSLVAGILLVIGGILGGLAGLAVAVVGKAVIESLGDLGTIPGMEGVDTTAFVSSFITFFGIVILLYSLVYLTAGIGVIRSREWGRILGISVGILSGLVWLGSVITPDRPNVTDSTVGSLIAFGIHLYVVVVLLLFWRSRAPAAS